jgi:acyl-homoserine-lactone acylase
MSPLGTYWRAQRTINMVKDNPSVSFEQLTGYKYNTELEAANRFLDDLLAAVRQYPDREAEKAAAVLNAWDRKCDTGSRGAVLFTAWWDQVNGSMFEVPWSQENPVSTPSGLKNKRKAVELLVRAARSVTEKYGSADVAWGDVNRFRIGRYDFPGNGAPDNCGVFRTMYFADDNDHKRRAVAGDTYIAVTEFGDKPKAEVILSYGNATQPGNIHQGDQLGMMSEKKLRPALLDRADILANLEKRETLNEITP